MNPNDPRHPWSRLTAAARRVPAERDATAPYGFATRVAALAQEHKAVSLIERFALRAVGVSCLLALLSVAVNYSEISAVIPVTAAASADDELAIDDPIAVLLSD